MHKEENGKIFLVDTATHRWRNIKRNIKPNYYFEINTRKQIQQIPACGVSSSVGQTVFAVFLHAHRKKAFFFFHAYLFFTLIKLKFEKCTT